MGQWNGIKTTALRGEKKSNPKWLYTSELISEDLDIKDVQKCNYKQTSVTWGRLNNDCIIHCGPLPCLSLLMTGNFLPALNLSTSASDSGGRGKLASIQPSKKPAVALVIFLHCILFMQYCHQQQHSVYHELNR